MAFPGQPKGPNPTNIQGLPQGICHMCVWSFLLHSLFEVLKSKNVKQIEFNENVKAILLQLGFKKKSAGNYKLPKIPVASLIDCWYLSLKDVNVPLVL